MNSIDARKQLLRRRLRIQRNQLDSSGSRAKSSRAVRHLLKLRRLCKARNISIYVSIGTEVQTAALMHALHRRGKAICVPQIVDASNSRMEMVRWHPGIALRPRPFGLREPLPAQRCCSIVDVAILPLLAYDHEGTRLGYGGGYYDRWLARQVLPVYCIGLSYAFQRVDHVPSEPHDIKLRAICTERGAHTFTKR